MKTFIINSLLVLFMFLCACKKDSSCKLNFLVGTWKIENKEQYEVWEGCEKGKLKGYSFKIVEEKEHILETLTISKNNNEIIYSATVPKQNEGKTIPFKLNLEIKNLLSFENLNHDFPKKIQYKQISSDEMFVSVLGDDDKGFSYTMFKQY